MARPGAATVALFISDLHLQPDAPRTARAFFSFLENEGRRTQQLYLLGDLFEYWAGDDDIDTPFNASVVAAIRAVSDAGVAVFWMAGNRDFLVGPAFCAATGATALPDPFVVTIAGQTMVLAHGDAQCTDDVDYIRFRQQVREPAWQAAFLEKPLAERHAMIARMRAGSRDAQRTKSVEIMDVNPQAIADLFDRSGTTLMIHGHTHRPALHATLQDGIRVVRHVLPDWDLDGAAPRGGALAIDAEGRLRSTALAELQAASGS